MGSEEASLTESDRATLGDDGAWRHRLWPSRSVESFVVSFPKSGRTWLRVLMAVVEARLRGEEAEAVVREWLEREAPHLAGKRVLFTHALSANAHERREAMSHFLGYIGDRPRLFLVRDPRDAIVSYYFQVAKRQRGTFSRDLGQFVRDPGYGIDRLLVFLRACEHSLRTDPGPCLVVAYEDLHRDPTATLASALDLFGVNPVREVLAEAVAFGRFENMRRLEVEGAFGSDTGRLAARDANDPESLKTRRGVIGGFREYLVGADLEYVEERIAALMPPALGYLEPGTPPSTVVPAVGA
jgi:hypothetical protein